MNVYHANAVALGGNIIRPFEQILESQADSSLSSGRGSKHVENFNFHGVLSFRHAYSEVDGSFDECHNVYTTYSHAVIEGLDIAGVVFADRIVSRLVVQSPIGSDAKQHSFDLTGSRFENLRIAGHRVDVPLATYQFHQYDTYAKLERAFQDGKAQDLLPWGILGDKQLENLEKHEEEFAGISGLGTLVRHWRQQKNLLLEDDTLWCSAAAHLNLSEQLGQSELQSFGSIILIPKFGSVSLAELHIQKQSRQLIMIRVRLSSPMDGNFQAGRTEVTGSRNLLPESQRKRESARRSTQPTKSAAAEIDNRTVLNANHGLVERPDRQLKMQAILQPNHHYTYWFEITAKRPPGADSEPFIEPKELNRPHGVDVQVQLTSSMFDGDTFESRTVKYWSGVGLPRQNFSLTTRAGDHSLVIQVIYNGHPVYSKKWNLRCLPARANEQAPDTAATTKPDIAPMPATCSSCRLVVDGEYVKRTSLDVPGQSAFRSAREPNSEVLVVRAAAARSTLNAFARKNPELDSSMSWPDTWSMLREMAIWGRESAEIIFGDRKACPQFYKALERLPFGSQLHIDSHPGSFPWEWVYLGKIPRKKPLDLNSVPLQDFLQGFFGYRFQCDVLPSADENRLEVVSTLANRNSTRVLNLVNATADPHVAPQHVKFVEDMELRYSLASTVHKGGQATLDALKEAVAKASAPTHLINVYCHHSPGTELNGHGFYNFGESTLYMKGKQEDAITRKQLKYDVRLSPFKKGAPVVLLNACGTALGDSYFPSGFIPYFTNELKVPAVIGTVAEVPTLAAHQFALEFIPLWLSRGSVHDAMSQLHRDWLLNRGNPYALFYTVYGNGAVHLEKSLKEIGA